MVHEMEKQEEATEKTLTICCLFDELDFFHKTATEGITLDKLCPLDKNEELGILNLEKEAEAGTPPFESLLDFDGDTSCMSNPFFDQFMDVNQLFPALASMELPDLHQETDTLVKVITSDNCQSDVVTEMADNMREYCEVASPMSEIIDVVSLDSDDVASPCSDLSDLVSSPEGLVDVFSVQGGDLSISVESIEPGVQRLNDPDLDAQVVGEQITVVETSDVLSLLTEELLGSSTISLDEGSETVSTMTSDLVDKSDFTIDIDQLLSISPSLELSGSSILPSLSVDECSVDNKHVFQTSAKTGSCLGKKRAHNSAGPSPAKKSKVVDDLDVPSPPIPEGLDKQTVRRLKNNIASKHARASRKLKEKDLFRQADDLEKSNAELRQQVEELTKQTTLLRKALVDRLSGASCMV